MVVYADNVSKSYRHPVFSGISFSLHEGEGLGVAGENGSGKTTLLDIVAGLVRPDSGVVEAHGRIGYVPQADGLSDRLSCLDNLRFYAALGGLRGHSARERIAQCAGTCGLDGFLSKRLSKCSAGMRQRVSIAAALLHRPTLLLLDEALSPLDISAKKAVAGVLLEIRKSGTAVIMVSHSPADFDGLCGRVLSMPAGSFEDLPQ